MGGSGGDGGISQAQAARQQQIEQGLASINKVFSGFTPQFYQGVQQKTLNALLPQLAQQHQASQQQLGYTLADKGLLHSSTARNSAASLAQQTALNESLVSNQAIQAGRDAQQNVAREKANVTSQLIASGDPTLAQQQALQAASQFQAPSQVAPLGNMFQGWVNTYLAGRLGGLYGGGQTGGQKPLGTYGFQGTTGAPLPVNSTTSPIR
jgi:hypothetical protein